mgnify:CR=1 FL=1
MTTRTLERIIPSVAASDGSVKTAIVMRKLGVDAARANHLLAHAGGRLDRVLSPG